MGRHEENQAKDQDDWYSKNEEEEMKMQCPTIRMTKEEKGRIQRPWRQTLTIKLLGEYKVPYPVQKDQRIVEAKSFGGLRLRLFFSLNAE